MATRQCSSVTLENISNILPQLMVALQILVDPIIQKQVNRSNKFKNFNGNYIHYGVREHGMAAIMNGLALYSGLIPYGGTF